MTASNVDPSLVLAWQVAHSVARGSPAPVPDREGYRVDTGSESEVKRWIFPRLCEGVRAVGREITTPRHYLKACVCEEVLASALPARWQVQSPGFFMTTAMAHRDSTPLPDGYRMELHHAGAVTRARIIAPDGDVAASGCAAETVDVFIYDRIETALDHRRKGLGLAVMAGLGSARRSSAAVQLLSATEEGRMLYEKLGWTVLAPLATAVIAQA